jgi:hypothetical protein
MKKDKPKTIIVNGRQKDYSDKEIDFNQVIMLAFGTVDNNPNAVYTITYSKNGKKESGVMVEGDKIKVHKGAIFNVTRTDKS